jgi:lipoprotein NlpD
MVWRIAAIRCGGAGRGKAVGAHRRCDRARLARVLLSTSALALLLLLMGCAGGLAPVDSRDGYGPTPPGYYRVRRGDTLSEIAERRRIPMRKLAAWNGLQPPYPLYAGNLLRIEPGPAASPRTASRTVASTGSPARAVKTKARAPASPGSGAGASGIVWQWPLRGPVKQGFNSGDRTKQGIRIGTSPGSSVDAAADGTVVYSGSGLKGYGNLIIVKHNSRYLSAYGYNRRLLASEGDRVKRGQQLAEAGQSADGQPLLHFEIRRDGVAVDPLVYLPASR